MQKWQSPIYYGTLQNLIWSKMWKIPSFLWLEKCKFKVRPYEIELIRRDYVANGGWETFLSYEDPEQDILVGLLRLRKLSEEVFR